MNAKSTSAANTATVTVWDLPLRLFHWLLVAAITIAFLSSDEDSAIGGWHIAAGWIAALLIVFRLVWGVVGGEHARFRSFIRPSHVLSHLKGLASGRAERTVGHNPAGGMAVLLLIGSIAAVVATGYLALQGGEEDLHEGIAWFLLGLIGIHVAAVIATSILSRENLARAMVTGKKQAADHPEVRRVQRASPAAFLLALLASSAAAAGIRTLDPEAFSLQPRGSAEREGGEAAARGASAGQHEETAERD